MSIVRGFGNLDPGGVAAAGEEFLLLLLAEHAVLGINEECRSDHLLPLAPARVRDFSDCGNHDVGVEPWVETVSAFFEVGDPGLREWSGAECDGRRRSVGKGNRPRTEVLPEGNVVFRGTATGIAFQEHQPTHKTRVYSGEQHRRMRTHRLPDEVHRVRRLGHNHPHGVGDKGVA